MNLEKATYDELQNYFEELLSTTIEVEPEPDPSFLHISGFPHYEEVISNWYVFFFDSTAAHGLRTLFIDTLVELVNSPFNSSPVVPFEKCRVYREWAVSDKRIDLLLFDESKVDEGGQLFRNAIIIENKVNALVYNDLDHYYQSITTEESKAAIVLSLVPQKELPDTYINITHRYFLERVITRLGNYLLRANSKYLLLLKDFVQQIQLFSKTESMKAYVSFYFENAEKINEINKLRNQAKDALLDDLYLALDGTPFKWGRKYPESVNIRYEPDPNVLIILKTDALFDKTYYSLALWLTYDNAKMWMDTAIRSRIKNEAVFPPDFEFNIGRTGSKQALIGYQEVTFTRSLEELERFPLKLVEGLKTEWHPFLQSILNLIK